MSEHMCVTVCTRERPQMLMACLRSVLPQLEASDVKTSLVVVENDSEPKNRQAILDLSRDYPSVRVEYRLEPELGIPFARNTAVDTALELGADWIFFIDDDEEACEGWFNFYLSAITDLSSDIFRGPVDYWYPPSQPDWLKLKSQDNPATGTLVKTAITNNLVVKSYVFSPSGLNIRFDARLRFTGGSDIAFSRSATSHGVKVRWVSEARVIERQTGKRLTAAWLSARAERSAANDVQILALQQGTAAAVAFVLLRCPRLAAHAGLRAFIAACTVFNANTSARNLHRARMKFLRIRGYLRGLSGYAPRPYFDVS